MKYRYLIKSVRLFSLPLTVGPVLLTPLYLLSIGSDFQLSSFIAYLVAVSLLHCVANLLNDYYDHFHGVDQVEGGGVGASGFIQSGELSSKSYLIFALLLLLLVAPLAVYLILQRGVALFLLGAAGLLITLLYTGRYISLKYCTLGEVAVFLAFGPLLLSSALYATAGVWSLSFFLFSLIFGLYAAAVLLCNNLRDMKSDREAKVVTLPLRFGEVFARRVAYLLLLVPPILVAVLILLHLFPLSFLMVLIVILFCSRIAVLEIKKASSSAYGQALERVLLLHLATTVSAAIAILCHYISCVYGGV